MFLGASGSTIGINETCARFNAVWAGSDSFAEIGDFVSPSVRFQYRMTAVKLFMQKLRAGFPDIAFNMDDELNAKEGWVVYEWRGRGTHTGPAYFDFLIGPMAAASGTAIELSGFNIVKLVDGRIAEEAIWSSRRQDELKHTSTNWFL